MSIDIYTIGGSPRGWRVLLGLAIKQLNYNINHLELSSREHKSEPYLQINPRGTVPSLVSGEVVLNDSIAILAWLDQQYPERPLFGSNPEESAAIWQLIRESCHYLRDAANSLLSPIFFSREPKATPDLCEAAISMQKELKLLDAKLEDNVFFVGGEPSAADAVIYPELRLVERAMETKPELLHGLGFQKKFTNYPNLSKWMQQVETIKGYDKTLPTHW